MNVWKIYGITDNGVIKDVIAYPFDDTGAIKSQVEANRRYGLNGGSIDVTNYHAWIGDTVSSGKIYRDGVELSKAPTEEEEINSLNNAVDDLIVAVLGG